MAGTLIEYRPIAYHSFSQAILYPWMPLSSVLECWCWTRACVELSEVGCLALAVLDGRVFVPRGPLEPAKTIADAVGATPAAKRSHV